MMHLHDILGMKIADYEAERRRLDVLFAKTKVYISDYGYVALKDVSEEPFRVSAIRGTSVNIDDLLNRCKGYWESSSVDGLFLYCEILVNILDGAERVLRQYYKLESIFEQLHDNILEILDKTGYELQKDEGGIYFITQKNAIATDVIHELDDKHLALAILEYNRFSLKGEIDRKRELLNVIGQAVEPILKDKSARAQCPEVYDDVRFALNRLNIRHNNEKGANEQPTFKELSKKDLETAYDDLYSSMLVLLKVSQLQEGHARMDALKKQMTKV